MTPPALDALLEEVRRKKELALLKLIADAGGMDIKSGHLTIHFDGQGAIGSIEVHRRYTVK